MRRVRVALAALGSLLWLSGCETATKLGDIVQSGSGKLGDLFQSKPADDSATSALAAAGEDPPVTGSTSKLAAAPPQEVPPGLSGSDVHDLALGRKFYESGNYRLAERHFRQAAQMQPRDAEAWIGLAAAYDRLKRFDLADRAYDETVAIIGVTPEVLNNRGYSYMLRGDLSRARTILLQAQAMDPSNPYVHNNLALLAKSARRGKTVE